MPLVAGEHVRTPLGFFRVVFRMGHLQILCDASSALTRPRPLSSHVIRAAYKPAVGCSRDYLNSVAYLRAISLTWSLVSCFRGTPGGLQVSRKKPSRPAGATIQSSSNS